MLTMNDFTTVTCQVHRLRKQLQAQDRKHEERIGEIKVLLRDVLKDQIIAHLSTHVHDMIREGVARIVKERVAAEVPQDYPFLPCRCTDPLHSAVATESNTTTVERAGARAQAANRTCETQPIQFVRVTMLAAGFTVSDIRYL
jgi:hypothetical protein